ncbi:MAG: glycerate kinase [Propionibacteriaceae bacterium]|nr:glycerate kinase [Propionibacteriaceae bacterium]
MRIIVAPDSFKESMSAVEAGAALEAGIRRVWPEADVTCLPMSDGGEGLVRVLTPALGGGLIEATVADCLGRPCRATYGWVPDQGLAVVEVAEAVGLQQVPVSERDPLRASTEGVGELLRAALDRGAIRIVVGLGGSATTDGGTGMLRALGMRFLDSAGQELPAGGGSLSRLGRIDTSGLDPRLSTVRIEVASDVNNPLLGSRGAAAVFSPQKGADPAQVERLEHGLTRFAELAGSDGTELSALAGAGAAGGLGFAFLRYLDATIRPGVDTVIEATGFEDALKRADYVFTGEGSIDAQSSSGKAPWGIASRASRRGIPVIGFAGRVGIDVADSPFTAVVPIVRGLSTLDEALRAGPENLERAAELTCRLLATRAGSADS